jgi:hypothetical protein
LDWGHTPLLSSTDLKQSCVDFAIATPAKSKQRAARYTIDLDAAAAKTGEQLPWCGAAHAYWQAKLGNSEEAHFAIATLLSNLDKSTAATYRSQWNTFEIKFCQPRGLAPIPASRETILSYLGWHAKRGTVQGARQWPGW